MINIKTNSGKVVSGDKFVALKGFTVDGHSFIPDAIKNGATKIICMYGEYEGVEVVHVEDTKKWLEDFLYETYKDEINKLTFIGVTGTNGKTTSCFLTFETLIKMHVPVCYIGTIGYFDKDEHYELPNTTPSMLDLYTMFINALEKGIKVVVMEVSSHSLCEKRVRGIEYQTIAFSNLTQDHLDYHKTMENYLQAKLLLVDQLKDSGKAIVNIDDSYGKYFMKKNGVSYGFEGVDLKILSYEDIPTGTNIKFTYEGKEYNINTKLKNKFNVYNYLMSLLLVVSLGNNIEEVLKYSDKILPPKGRCDKVLYDNGQIIIDYAHTPDAVEKIITSFKETTKGKIITIVGCGGDRDKTKRPIMGRIATENSNYVILTSDNPRTEDPNEILKDIVAGVSTDNYEVIVDRIEAIKHGIDLISKDDTLLILGKGHEDYQIIGHTKHHMDDREIAEEHIKELKNRS